MAGSAKRKLVPKKSEDEPLIYGVNDTPVWYASIALGLQQYLIMFGSTVGLPLILAGPLGIENNGDIKGQLIGTIMFACGIATMLQTTFGTRLPIIQGGAGAFLIPAIAVMQSIPDMPVAANNTNVSDSNTADPTWKIRMREIQGAIMIASCLQIVLGATGLIGFLMSHVGPLTIGPTIAMVGIGLFGISGDFAGSHWGISILTMFLIIFFSQHLRNVEVPLFYYTRSNGWKKVYVKLFSLFPIIMALFVSWIVCAVLTAAGAFPDDPSVYGYHARTDIRLGVISDAAWFRIPHPGQWGLPTVSVSAVLGMISGVLVSIIESVGDYYACARICKIRSPPSHAVNRGIFVEGIGCFVAGIFGTGNGTTSYSQNIAAIGITKVASRRVIQISALFMMLLAVVGKFGAFFVTIPDPVIGGLFFVMSGMITAVGLSSLQFVDLNSSRNLLVAGFSIFVGITVPEWMKKNEELLATGITELDQVILVLLKTGMFLSGLVAFILDNTIPGTKEERGIIKWKQRADTLTSGDSDEVSNDDEYELPGPIAKRLSKVKAISYVPICPSRRNEKREHTSSSSHTHEADDEEAIHELTEPADC